MVLTTLNIGIWCIRAVILCRNEMNVSNINNALLSEYRNLKPRYNAPNIKT